MNIRMEEVMAASEQISLFCRIQVNTKKAIPIRSSEMGMLMYLVKTEEEKTPIAVAHFFKVSKAMATNMVRSLSAKGYIEKKQSSSDRRSYQLIPTDKAVDLVENTCDEYFRTVSMLQERMGAERFTEFITLMEQANTILLEDRANG